MKEMQPTLDLLENTHGVRFGRRPDRAKGVRRGTDARSLDHRWEDRTDDIEVYYFDVKIPRLQMYIDAGLGTPVFFRNVDGNEQGRFPSYRCSCSKLRNHPAFANQGEDYDGDLDTMILDSVSAAGAAIDGAQRFWIRRARKIRDIGFLPDPAIVKHPRNGELLRQVRKELEERTGQNGA